MGISMVNAVRLPASVPPGKSKADYVVSALFAVFEPQARRDNKIGISRRLEMGTRGAASARLLPNPAEVMFGAPTRVKCPQKCGRRFLTKQTMVLLWQKK